MRRWLVLAWFATLALMAVLSESVASNWATELPHAAMRAAGGQRFYRLAGASFGPGSFADRVGAGSARLEDLQWVGPLALSPNPVQRKKPGERSAP